MLKDEAKKAILQREKRKKKAMRAERNQRFRGVFTRYPVGYLLPGIPKKYIIEVTKSKLVRTQNKT